MNSPRPGSSVYPLTPFPVERIRFAEEPYLEVGRIMSNVDPDEDRWRVSNHMQ